MSPSPDGTKAQDCSGRRPRNELSLLHVSPFLRSTPNLAAGQHLADIANLLNDRFAPTAVIRRDGMGPQAVKTAKRGVARPLRQSRAACRPLRAAVIRPLSIYRKNLGARQANLRRRGKSGRPAGFGSTNAIRDRLAAKVGPRYARQAPGCVDGGEEKALRLGIF